MKQEGLCGGISYFDGQFDDSRYAISLARTFVDHLGGTAINYIKVHQFIQHNQQTIGVIAEDLETGNSLELTAKVVINATGIFTDELRKLDDLQSTPILKVSQGSHLVIDRHYLLGPSDETRMSSPALMIPKTTDKRVLFGIPWHGKLIIGTTDTPVNQAMLEPHILKVEADFLQDHLKKYFKNPPLLHQIN